MGMFSWITSDTNKSVSNKYSGKGALPCSMILPDESRFNETDYNGYGVFGGKDFYEAVYELNKDRYTGDKSKEKREKGIEIFYGPPLWLPKIVSIGWKGKYASLQDSENCSKQGFFY